MVNFRINARVLSLQRLAEQMHQANSYTLVRLPVDVKENPKLQLTESLYSKSGEKKSYRLLNICPNFNLYVFMESQIDDSAKQRKI